MGKGSRNISWAPADQEDADATLSTHAHALLQRPSRTPTSRESVHLPSDQDASGRSLGDEELSLIAEVIESGTLTSTKGPFVKELEQEFARRLGVAHALACSSGTAAIHAAIAAVNPEPGDEIVTTPITDMGAIAPILYQAAIPVFADVDPSTWNVTAGTIERVLSPRTRAIIVTHLFGCPCPMGEIMELARARGIVVIEDCAQAFLAESRGRLVGAIGDIGCFSLQQGKHITCGEGGLVVTNSPEFARRMFLFVNKAWGYGDATPDHYFLALNGRMSELQGAVALAQLGKLDANVDRREQMAARLSARLEGTSGITLPRARRGDRHVYWKYCLGVDPSEIPGGAVALGKSLQEQGVACAPRYIQKPAFACEVIRGRKTFGASGFPFTLARPEAVDYRREMYPGTFEGLERALVLPLNERYEPRHIDHVAAQVVRAVDRLVEGGLHGA
jgi:dTDP-4-amino-4,6-dideoxygalactose transaminase